MRPSFPIPALARVLLLIVLLSTATAGLLLVPAAAHADPGSAPAEGVWPLDPRPEVVARFDPPDSRWGAGHRGVDLAGHVGQPVRAAAPGRVTFAGTLAGRGVVVVDHGTTRTTYEPVDASVAVGDRVPAGAMVGRLQLFGSHCFPRACLHWGLIEGRDRYLDPLTLVGAGPVRLLPLDGTPLLVGTPPLGGPSVGPPPTAPWPETTIPAPAASGPASGPRMRLAEGLP
jgi:murein DD-endopeptidase MepM/ murein hydrolase activator NlpD